MTFEQNTIENVDDSTSIVYRKYKMPILAERDNISTISIMKLENDQIFGVVVSADHKDCPPVDGIVRMHV